VPLLVRLFKQGNKTLTGYPSPFNAPALEDYQKSSKMV